jgi:hypothetical protein
MPPFIFEEPVDIPVDSGPPPEPEPESPMQTFWRFIMGLIGLSSAPAQPDMNGEIPPDSMPIDGGFGPGEGGGPVNVEIEAQP